MSSTNLTDIELPRVASTSNDVEPSSSQSLTTTSIHVEPVIRSGTPVPTPDETSGGSLWPGSYWTSIHSSN